MRRSLARTLVVTVTVAILGILANAPSALAYGNNTQWQLGFAGTLTAPSTGFGFGFWGWCAFGGGVTSGNTGDCQVSQYFHSPSGRVTCEQDINITSWTGAGGTFVLLSGTTTTHPASAPCQLAGGLPPTFNPPGFDTMIPAAAAHYNLTSFFLFPGTVGELQVQVTQLP
jgi:hypothetical protein